MPPRRCVTLIRWRASSSGVASLTAAVFALAASGCLSNEYRIQKDELRRLVEIAPEARGQSVRVSQTLGDRRSDAVDPSLPERAPDSAQGDVSLQINGDLGGGEGSRTAPAHEVHAPPSRAQRSRAVLPQTLPTCRGNGLRRLERRRARSSGGFRGTLTGERLPRQPPSGGGFHGTSSGGGLHGGSSGGGWHGGSSGGGGFNFSGGGKDIGGVLIVIVIVAVVAATAATVSLAASEGVRFEGHAEMAPEQLIYLKNQTGTLAVPLLELTREQVARSDHALVMDDEGYGLRRIDHAPLDRKGGVFRFDLGAGAFTVGDAHASGLSAHIQGGYFFTHTFGAVFDLGLGGGTLDPCCVGALAPRGSLTRHSLGLEAQLLPLALGPLHLGGFAGGGLAIAGVGGNYEDGPMANGGALLELDITSHMALVMRGGASRAWLPSGPSSAGTLTGGLSIY